MARELSKTDGKNIFRELDAIMLNQQLSCLKQTVIDIIQKPGYDSTVS